MQSIDKKVISRIYAPVWMGPIFRAVAVDEGES